MEPFHFEVALASQDASYGSSSSCVLKFVQLEPESEPVQKPPVFFPGQTIKYGLHAASAPCHCLIYIIFMCDCHFKIGPLVCILRYPYIQYTTYTVLKIRVAGVARSRGFGWSQSFFMSGSGSYSYSYSTVKHVIVMGIVGHS